MEAGLKHQNIKAPQSDEDLGDVKGFENCFTGNGIHDHLLGGEVCVIRAFEPSLDADKVLLIGGNKRPPAKMTQCVFIWLIQ